MWNLECSLQICSQLVKVYLRCWWCRGTSQLMLNSRNPGWERSLKNCSCCSLLAGECPCSLVANALLKRRTSACRGSEEDNGAEIAFWQVENHLSQANLELPMNVHWLRVVQASSGVLGYAHMEGVHGWFRRGGGVPTFQPLPPGPWVCCSLRGSCFAAQERTIQCFRIFQAAQSSCALCHSWADGWLTRPQGHCQIADLYIWCHSDMQQRFQVISCWGNKFQVRHWYVFPHNLFMVILVAPYRAILRYYRCDTPYRAILLREVAVPQNGAGPLLGT